MPYEVPWSSFLGKSFLSLDHCVWQVFCYASQLSASTFDSVYYLILPTWKETLTDYVCIEYGAQFLNPLLAQLNHTEQDSAGIIKIRKGAEVSLVGP